MGKKNFSIKKRRLVTIALNALCAKKQKYTMLQKIYPVSKHKVISIFQFYFLNCLRSFRKKKLELHTDVCKNKDFCNIIMPSEGTKILEFNQYKKSGKAPFIIYADLERLTKNINGCKNNSENSSTIKIGKHILSGFSMSIILFKIMKKKHDVHRG